MAAFAADVSCIMSEGHMRRIAIGASALALLTIAGPALAESLWTTANVNLRAGPGTSYAALATLSKGTEVEAGACAKGWCQVSAAGRRGYVSRQYLQSGLAQADAKAREMGFRNAREAWACMADSDCYVCLMSGDPGYRCVATSR